MNNKQIITFVNTAYGVRLSRAAFSSKILNQQSKTQLFKK